MEEADNKVLLTSCNHSFHTKCISEWKKKSRVCPVCALITESATENTPRSPQDFTSLPEVREGFQIYINGRIRYYDDWDEVMLAEQYSDPTVWDWGV
jgi:hypothetical protein